MKSIEDDLRKADAEVLLAMLMEGLMKESMARAAEFEIPPVEVALGLLVHCAQFLEPADRNAAAKVVRQLSKLMETPPDKPAHATAAKLLSQRMMAYRKAFIMKKPELTGVKGTA
ncbi:MAG: hypothetical protein AAGD40_12385 [Pseudomonadota bacterium]